MEAKFTPGPWQAHITEDGLFVSPEGRDNDPVTCDLVTRLSSYDETLLTYAPQAQDEDEANAHLIAAAPNLYEVLEQAIEQIAPVVAFQEFNGVPQGAIDFIKLSKGFEAALAKARGEKEGA